LNLEPKRPSLLPQFTEARSFRLCTEGIEALERFERQASAAQLHLAETRLEECVRLYPSDLIPKFYLGTVKTLTGYSGLDRAEELLKEVAESGVDELRIPAQLNLAVAYIERYDLDAFTEADRILQELTDDPAASKGATRRMVWAARANRLYIQAHLFWSHRDWSSENIPYVEGAPKLRAQFEAFKAELDKSECRNDSEILADYWNALGTLSEAQSSWNPFQKDQFAAEAKLEYETALQYKKDWIDTTSNLARLYQNVLGDPDKAEELWAKVFEIRPNDAYAHYNLGRLEQSRGNNAKAREHYAKAPKIPEAVAALRNLPLA
jgi:tetratricopeptide (TPR) repeat protein